MAELNSDTSKKLRELSDNFNAEMRTLNSDTKKQLQQLKDEFEKKVGIIKTDTEKQFKEMIAVVNDIMKISGWTKLGEQMVTGLISGIQKMESDFYTTVSNLMNEGVDKAKSVMDIHSPSRVFAEIGKYMVDGLVVGIETFANKVSNASKDMAQSAIDTTSNIVSKLSTIVNGDFDLTPTIRPVIDLTDIANGVGRIDNYLNTQRSMNLSAMISSQNQNGRTSQSDDLLNQLHKNVEISNGKIVSAIESLRGDFSNLLDRVGQLQVVMDTGTLVGAIASDMDGALGRLDKMNRRGIR